MRASPGLRALAAELRGLAGDDARLYRFGRTLSLWLVPITLALVILVLGTGPTPHRDWVGRCLGCDFSQVWVAGRTALRGAAAESYDLAHHVRNIEAAFGPDCPYAWHYPPVFLLPAVAAASLPLQPAFLIWSLAGLGLFAAALRRVGGGPAALLGLAHPLVLSNLSYGQNGLYTAALLTFGALLVDRRPWVAGLCFGLIAYKPHLAALAPMLLLATGRWRCLAACLGTAAALCLASLLAFGTAPWWAFLHSLGMTDRVLFREAAAGLDINVSAFGAMQLAGLPISTAWTVQGLTSAAVLALAWRIWATGSDPLLRAAMLLVAAPMISPYAPVYDLVPLVPATAMLVVVARRTGALRAYERALLIATPLSAGLRAGADATGICFGFVFALATLACLLPRAFPERARPQRGAGFQKASLGGAAAPAGAPAG